MNESIVDRMLALWKDKSTELNCGCVSVSPKVCARACLKISGLMVEHGLECACDCHVAVTDFLIKETQ